MPGRSDRATTKIFVGNLPDRYPDDSLRELFEQYGEVSECDVIKNFAFVHFVSDAEAEAAVKGLNGAEVKGKNVRVEISEKSRGGRGGGGGGGDSRGGDTRGSSGAGGRKDGGSTKLFVGNLPDGYPDDTLRVLFEQYGEVTECDVLKNFGFVHFRKPEDAEKAKDGLATHEIDGKRIRVESSGAGSRGSSGAAGTKLFVGNLPDDFPSSELRAMFEKYGRVVECDIIKHFAFVHFDNQRDATAAKDALNNARLKDRNIRVQVSNTGVRQKAGMGDSDGCFGCGERGHWSKECPNQGRGRSGGVSGGKDRDTCNRCGESGHWARDCPKPSDWRPRDAGRDGRDAGRRGYDDRSDYGRGRSDYDRGISQIGVVSSRDNLGRDNLGRDDLGRGISSSQMGGATMGGGLSLGGGIMGAAATMGGGLGLSLGGAGLSTRDPYAPVRDPYGAPRPDPYASQRADPYGATRQDPYGPPRSDGYGDPQRDPYGPPRDGFRSSDPYPRESGYPSMRDRSPLRAPPTSVPSDSFFRRSPPRSMPPKEDMYSRVLYGAIDERPSYGGVTEPMAPQYSQSSLGSGAVGGLATGRSFPMEQDRYGGQMVGGAQMSQVSGAHASGLGDLGMGNGASRGNAIGYPQTQSMGSSVGDGRSMGGYPATSHMPTHGSSQDRGFGGVYGYGR